MFAPSILSQIPDKPPWYKRLGGWLRRTTGAPKSFRDKHLRLQFGFTLVAVILAVTLTQLFFYDWPNWQKAAFDVLIGIACFFLTDPLAAYTLFRLPGSTPFGLAEHWHSFVKAFSHVNDRIQRAELFLLITKHTAPDVHLYISFADYLKVLCAATHFAQREWFATYVFELGKWPKIAASGFEYFEALQNTELQRHRVVIRPKTEVDAIQVRDSIVRDTHRSKARLTCVPEELLQTLQMRCPDFALFDDSLVIVATDNSDHSKADLADYDPERDYVNVHVYRSKERTGLYSVWKQYLKDYADLYPNDVKDFPI